MATAPVICIGPDLLQAIETHADLTGKNVRFCLHPDAECGLQEMIILQHADQFFPPKQHPHKAKSFQVLTGELAVFTFSVTGEISGAHHLAAGETILCRIGPGIFHADIPLTPRTIHLETTTGPFHRESDRIMAAWAPAAQDHAACRDFREHLLRKLSPTGGTPCMSS